MRKIISLLLAIAFLFRLPVFAAAANTAVSTASQTAVLMDAATGQVLYNKEMEKTIYPASTTKIMTCLLVTELCSPDEIITVSKTALEIEEWNSTNINLIVGEKLTVRDALYALMLSSANDAANALAEHAAGSKEAFVQKMNQRAKQIGARHTSFQNAHGLHEDSHHTTAYDMALITRAAMQSPAFMRYFGADLHTMPGTNLTMESREFYNYQSMLVDDTEYYDANVTGGKVGFTIEAQHTMSTSAFKDGRTLLCVVMHSTQSAQKFTDTRRLFEYGFQQFRQISIPAARCSAGPFPVGEEEGDVRFYAENDFTALLRNDLREEEVAVIPGQPAQFADDSSLPTSIEVSLATPAAADTRPTLLGVQPVVTELRLKSAFPLSQQKGSFFALVQGNISLFFLFSMAVCGVLLILAGILLSRYHTLKKRKGTGGHDTYSKGKK